MSEKINARRVIRIAVTTICIICLLVSVATIAGDFIKTQKRQSQTAQLQQLKPGAKNEDASETGFAGLMDMLFPTALAEGEAAKAVHDDFMDLYAINKDLVGWYDMGKSISLPVVQGADNSYYLKHDFYGQADESGSLFINAKSNIWPMDRELLMHGHNMRDNSVLGSMDNFRKLDWLKENPIFYLQLVNEGQKRAYVPLAFLDASMNKGSNGYFDIGYGNNFADDAHFLEYVGTLMERSLFDIPVDVNAEDQLLTIITCSYTYDNSRFICVARALRADETVEDVTALVQQSTQR